MASVARFHIFILADAAWHRSVPHNQKNLSNLCDAHTRDTPMSEASSSSCTRPQGLEHGSK